MCIDIVLGGRKPYGFLFKNDLNEFVYSCSECDEEFPVGYDLEQHTINHDVKDEIKIEINRHRTHELEPVVLYPSHSVSLDSVKDEENPLDGDTEDKLLEYLPFKSVKLELNIVPDERNTEITDLLNDNDDDSYEFQNDISSSEDVGTSMPKKKTPKKGLKKESKKNDYHCDICTRVFTSLARIRQHMDAIHTKPAKIPPTPTLCSLCGKYIQAMKTHLKIFHSTERPFKCNYCEAAFKRKANLDVHIRTHTGEKPYICHLCGRSYLTQTILSSHVKQHHFKLKPHKCDQCGKAYRQHYQLKDHINLHHLNQKLYQCEVCDRRFGTRKHLKQHTLSHGEKRYQCKFCDQKFATTSGRRGHEIRNHGAI